MEALKYIDYSVILLAMFVVSIFGQTAVGIHLYRYTYRKNNISRIMMHMLILCILLSGITFLAIHASNADSALILHSISFLLYDVVIAYFFVYVEIYINEGKIVPIRVAILGGLVLVDVISMIANIFLEHVFSCIDVYVGLSHFYGYNTGFLYGPHWVFSMAMAGISLFRLIYKANSVPRIYRRKYTSIFFSVVAVLIINLGFVATMGRLVDVSAMFLPFTSLVVYYFGFVYAPVDFSRRARMEVVENMDNGIILLDYNGKYLEANNSARSLLGLNEDNAQQLLDAWTDANNIVIGEEKEYEFKDKMLSGDITLRVKCNNFLEPKTKGLVTGSYIKIQDRTEDVRRQKRELYAARHDTLTGVLTRQAFFEDASEYIDKLDKVDHYMVCTDIENFKLYNTLFGVAEGDRFISNVAQSINRLLTHGEPLGRIGADRLCVLIAKEDFNEMDFAECFKIALSLSSNVSYSVNAYLGIFEVTKKDFPVPTMCDRAIIAVQNAKGHPDKFACYYTKDMTQSIMEEQELIDELRAALQRHEFVIYIQPQVRADGQVLGGEALVRWKHPIKGIVSPFAFISVMEKHGMIADLDYEVWRMAASKLKEWKEKGVEDKYISVNISPKDFYYRNIYKTFTSLVEEYDIDPRKLKLEVTESAIMQNEGEQIELIDRMREYGFTVEMDDFGSGYSSLNMLNKLNVDVIKIDMGFLRKGADEDRSKKIIKLIEDITENLGMESIVEGVETEEQAEYLKSIGCNIFQGYLYSPPIPMDEFEAKYMK